VVHAVRVVGPVEPVDADQERRQGLSRPGRRRDQGVPPGRDLPPPFRLWFGRAGREPPLEPCAHGRMKRLEHALTVPPAPDIPRANRILCPPPPGGSQVTGAGTKPVRAVDRAGAGYGAAPASLAKQPAARCDE